MLMMPVAWAIRAEGSGMLFAWASESRDAHDAGCLVRFEWRAWAADGHDVYCRFYLS